MHRAQNNSSLFGNSNIGVAERRQFHAIEGLSLGKYNLSVFRKALIHFAVACPKCHKALIRAEQYLHRPQTRRLVGADNTASPN
jgi:hypothetical protein